MLCVCARLCGGSYDWASDNNIAVVLSRYQPVTHLLCPLILEFEKCSYNFFLWCNYKHMYTYVFSLEKYLRLLWCLSSVGDSAPFICIIISIIIKNIFSNGLVKLLNFAIWVTWKKSITNSTRIAAIAFSIVILFPERVFVYREWTNKFTFNVNCYDMAQFAFCISQRCPETMNDFFLLLLIRITL